MVARFASEYPARFPRNSHVLGAAGEAIGYDRHLRTSTTSRRVHSLFRQGVMYYQLIPNMTEERLRPLILQFEKLIRDHQLLKRTFGII